MLLAPPFSVYYTRKQSVHQYPHPKLKRLTYYFLHYSQTPVSYCYSSHVLCHTKSSKIGASLIIASSERWTQLSGLLFEAWGPPRPAFALFLKSYILQQKIKLSLEYFTRAFLQETTLWFLPTQNSSLLAFIENEISSVYMVDHCWRKLGFSSADIPLFQSEILKFYLQVWQKWYWFFASWLKGMPFLRIF